MLKGYLSDLKKCNIIPEGYTTMGASATGIVTTLIGLLTNNKTIRNIGLGITLVGLGAGAKTVMDLKKCKGAVTGYGGKSTRKKLKKLY